MSLSEQNRALLERVWTKGDPLDWINQTTRFEFECASLDRILNAARAEASATPGQCFECHADLIGPICPACNPELSATPVRLEREAVIELIMRATTDEVVADGWQALGKPNILVQGCRFVRGPNGRGYEKPEEAARKFAGFIADDILALSSSLLVQGGEEGSSVAESGGTASPKSDGLCKLDGAWGEGPFYLSDAIHYIELLLGFAEPLSADDETAVQEATAYALEARAFIASDALNLSPSAASAGKDTRDELLNSEEP